jgi:hypothetical protein
MSAGFTCASMALISSTRPVTSASRSSFSNHAASMSDQSGWTRIARLIVMRSS